jgi:hypothetical protein
VVLGRRLDNVVCQSTYFNKTRRIKMAIKTIEQFNAYAENLPESVDRRRLAKALGLELPKAPVVIPPVGTQLAEMKLITHTPKTSEEDTAGVERTYVEIPAIKLEGGGTRKVWVRAEVARAAFQRGLELCDKHNL